MRTARRAAAATAVLALLATVPAAAQPDPGADLGYVRLGHLSPEVPPVDIYLAPFGGQQQVIIRKAGYGAVTPYSSLAPGAYTVAMRPANAGAATPPALSATVQIERGTAYSPLVFATGPRGELRGDLVIDDLTAPPAGTGRLRIAQGTSVLSPVTVEVAGGGAAIATAAVYGMTTPYRELAEGRYELRVRGADVDSPARVDVRAGTSTTLLVTQEGGALRTQALTDSAGPATAPLLGVETGGGAAHSGRTAWTLGKRVAS